MALRKKTCRMLLNKDTGNFIIEKKSVYEGYPEDNNYTYYFFSKGIYKTYLTFKVEFEEKQRQLFLEGLKITGYKEKVK